ncbi:MAG: SusC/RagA family TonB-linked outer membrane protein, partial [Muribaculaceae bacterium]|nr:SusC/RagA family TonB-linked outer membrane protein [Muribaculaceae bacterium]
LVQFVGGDPTVRTTDTDWQDQVYHSAWTNNLTASVSNSSERGSFMFSANYINQNGMMKETFYRRYSARVNSNYNFNKYVMIGENLMIANWEDRGFATQDDRGIPFTAMRQHPALPVRGIDGAWMTPISLGISDISNPLQDLYNGRDNKNQSWRILGNMYLAVMPVDGLTLKTNLGIEHVQYFNKTLNRKATPSDSNGMSRAYGQGDTWTWSNTANYVKTFNNVHNLNVLFGVEAIKYTFEDISASRKDYLFEDDNYMQIGSGEGEQMNGGGKSQWGLFSVFGKVDYNYADRYLASFTIRRDQSSRLDKNHNSGVFPAVTAAWRPTSEAFFPENEVLNDMKVRVAWGQNGNSAIGNWYASYSTYAPNLNGGSYDLYGTNNSSVTGLVVAKSGNTNLKWETTTQTNIGVDFRFFNGSLGLTADYYIKKTTDMLTIPPVLSVAGENAAMYMNTGDMDNHGWELQLDYNSPQYGDFSWSGALNMSAYRNKLVRLNSKVETMGGDIRAMVGKPLGVYYGYVCDGIFQNADEVANHALQQGAAAGRLKYRDIDGNGVINENDRCVIGDPNPDFSMGLNLDFRYRDFTLSTFF